MHNKVIPSSINNDSNNTEKWIIICYGNILRSQTLEQYLKYYSKKWGMEIEFYSAGVAEWDEFPNTDELLKEVNQELQKRAIPCSLNRNAWDRDVEKKISTSDIVLFADNEIKATVFKRMGTNINRKKSYTFYEKISEGEIDFEDTYDYELNRQDPIRFRNAFNELDRIACKMLDKDRVSLSV